MPATRVGRIESSLTPGDHPYLNGAWTPNYDEYDATGMEVIGEIPSEDGLYLRNTKNGAQPSALHPSTGTMIHTRVSDARRVPHRFVAPVTRNRRAVALAAYGNSRGPSGRWGAHGALKDAIST